MQHNDRGGNNAILRSASICLQRSVIMFNQCGQHGMVRARLCQNRHGPLVPGPHGPQPAQSTGRFVQAHGYPILNNLHLYPEWQTRGNMRKWYFCGICVPSKIVGLFCFECGHGCFASFPTRLVLSRSTRITS